MFRCAGLPIKWSRSVFCTQLLVGFQEPWLLPGLTSPLQITWLTRGRQLHQPDCNGSPRWNLRGEISSLLAVRRIDLPQCRDPGRWRMKDPPRNDPRVTNLQPFNPNLSLFQSGKNKQRGNQGRETMLAGSQWWPPCVDLTQQTSRYIYVLRMDTCFQVYINIEAMFKHKVWSW